MGYKRYITVYKWYLKEVYMRYNGILMGYKRGIEQSMHCTKPPVSAEHGIYEK